MLSYKVIGLSYEEVEVLEKELNFTTEIDKGHVYLDAGYDEDDDEYDDLMNSFIDKVNTILGINIPRFNTLFGQDGDQEFEFYIGIMYEE